MLSDSQLVVLAWCMIVAGCLSIAGALFVVISWYVLPAENKGLSKRLLAWVALTDFLSAMVFVFNGIAILSGIAYYNHPATCTTVAFMLTWSVGAGLLFHLCTGYYLHDKMVLQNKDSSPILCRMPCARTTGKVRRRDVFIISFSFGLSFLVAILPVLAPAWGDTAYTRTTEGDMCWLDGPNAGAWRLGLAVPAVLLSVACWYYYVRVVRTVLAGARMVRETASRRKLHMAAIRVAAYPVIISLPVLCLLTDAAVAASGAGETTRFVTSAITICIIGGRGLMHGSVYVGNAQNARRYGKVARNVRRSLSSAALSSSLARFREGSSMGRDDEERVPLTRQEGNASLGAGSGASERKGRVWRIKKTGGNSLRAGAGAEFAEETANPAFGAGSSMGPASDEDEEETV